MDRDRVLPCMDNAKTLQSVQPDKLNQLSQKDGSIIWTCKTERNISFEQEILLENGMDHIYLPINQASMMNIS